MYIDPHLIWKFGHNNLHKNRPWSTYDDIVVARIKKMEKKIAKKKFIPKGRENMLDKIINKSEHPGHITGKASKKRITFSEKVRVLVRVALMIIQGGKLPGWKASQEQLDVLRFIQADSDEDDDKNNMPVNRHLIWKEGHTSHPGHFTPVFGKASEKRITNSDKLDFLGALVLKMYDGRVGSEKLPQEELDRVRNMLGEVESSKDLYAEEDEDEDKVDPDEEEDVNEHYLDEDDSDEDYLDEDEDEDA